jgi:hypothetical protein
MYFYMIQKISVLLNATINWNKLSANNTFVQQKPIFTENDRIFHKI